MVDVPQGVSSLWQVLMLKTKVSISRRIITGTLTFTAARELTDTLPRPNFWNPHHTPLLEVTQVLLPITRLCNVAIQIAGVPWHPASHAVPAHSIKNAALRLIPIKGAGGAHHVFPCGCHGGVVAPKPEPRKINDGIMLDERGRRVQCNSSSRSKACSAEMHVTIRRLLQGTLGHTLRCL